MEKKNENEKLELIKEKIRKNLRMDILEIQEIYDEETGKFTEEGKAYTEAYLRGIQAGKTNLSLQLAFMALDMLELVKNETGLSYEELKYMKEHDGKVQS